MKNYYCNYSITGMLSIRFYDSIIKYNNRIIFSIEFNNPLVDILGDYG